jgi:hypothetical protein
MEREEEYIHSKFGKQQPFRVPEGYFDQFANQLMQQLPEREEPSAKVVRMRPRFRWQRLASVAAAACLGVVLYNVANRSLSSSSEQQLAAQVATLQAGQSAVSQSEFDQMADYAMIDVGDMYAYVSGN